MNEKVLKTLEYNKIIARLAEHASSEDAKKRCLTLTPGTDINEINLLQLQTKDALNRLFKGGRIRCTRHPRLPETFRDRCILKHHGTAARLLSLRGSKTFKSIFPHQHRTHRTGPSCRSRRDRRTSGRLTDRIFRSD